MARFPRHSWWITIDWASRPAFADTRASQRGHHWMTATHMSVCVQGKRNGEFKSQKKESWFFGDSFWNYFVIVFYFVVFFWNYFVTIFWGFMDGSIPQYSTMKTSPVASPVAESHPPTPRCKRNSLLSGTDKWKKTREIIWKYMKMLVNQYLLVGGLEHGFHFSIYWECHDPNWRTQSFFRGVGIPPTSYMILDNYLTYIGILATKQTSKTRDSEKLIFVRINYGGLADCISTCCDVETVNRPQSTGRQGATVVTGEQNELPYQLTMRNKPAWVLPDRKPRLGSILEQIAINGHIIYYAYI